MKSRADFTDDQSYREYLNIYFIGQALTGIATKEGTKEHLVKRAFDIARYAIDHIKFTASTH